MKSQYRIGSVWGIPIYLHISLFLLMAYFALRGGMQGFHTAGTLGGLVAIVFVLAFEILLFASIALHELGHSFVAIRKGCRVREITLMFIGGAAKMEQIPRRPQDEFLMAVAGPAVSGAVGICCIMLSRAFAAGSSGWINWLSDLSLYLGIVNFLLAGFNLIPAFPMDGGRIFRAVISPKFGRLRATYFAARLGKIMAVLMALTGVFGIPGIPILENGSLFLILISGFVFVYGDREYRMVQIEELMRKRGFGEAQSPFGESGEEMDLDDQTVLISPPPYAQGPAQRTEIHRARPPADDPFRRFFRS